MTTYNRSSFADEHLQISTLIVPQVWGTAFATPPALTGLVATYDPLTSAVTLAWDASPIDPPTFYQYRVYRRIDDGPMLRIDDDAVGDLLEDQASPSFVDWEAPLGPTLSYQVTTTNGALEGDPAEVQTAVPLAGYWLCLPGDDAHCWQLRWPQPGVSLVPRKRQTVKQPMGRTTWLVTSGPTMLPSGHVQVMIGPEDIGDLDRLREASDLVPAASAYAVLKDVLGGARRVVLGELAEAVGAEGVVTVDFDWWSVRQAAGEAAA